MRLRLLVLLSLAWLLGFCVLAQQQQPPTPPPQTPPQNPPTQPPTQPPSQPPGSNTGTSTSQQSTRSPFEFARPVYLRGCVRLDNGSVPGEPVRVWLAPPGSGGGVPRAGGGIAVDLGGCFRVQFGVADVTTSDPRLAGARMSEDLSGWEVRAELPGYGSGSALIKEHSSFIDIDVGTIVLTPFPNVDPGTISLNSLSAPRDAREAYLKAKKALDGKEPDRNKAAKELQKAVSKYTRYAAAWQLLGEVYEGQKDEVQARLSFEKAISADPKYLTPYLSLGNIELRNQRWAELSKLSRAILQLNQDTVEGQYFPGSNRACSQSGSEC